MNKRLTPTEQAYLNLLFSRDTPIKADEFIGLHMHSEDLYNVGNLVSVHLKNLRRKLKDFYVIEVVKGVGYTIKKI